MSRSSALILLGFLVVLAPFSGLPSNWLRTLIPVLGLGVIVVGFIVRAERVKSERDAHAPLPPTSSPHEISSIA